MITKPILFSAPMVKAILAGKKTMTRRVMKPQPHEQFGKVGKIDSVFGKDSAVFQTWLDRTADGKGPMEYDFNAQSWRCPHPVGSIMWVKETWQTDAFRDNVAPCLCSGSLRHYCADGPAPPVCGFRWGKKRPSMFMPKWASRISLEVTAVKVERVASISEEDARAEGVDGPFSDLFTPRRRFEDLWESINGARPGCSWSENPFVWVYEFKRVEVTA